MPYGDLPTPNVIGPARNAKMIGRCHTNSKPDEHTLEGADTDSWTGGILERAHSVLRARQGPTKCKQLGLGMWTTEGMNLDSVSPVRP